MAVFHFAIEWNGGSGAEFSEVSGLTAATSPGDYREVTLMRGVVNDSRFFAWLRTVEGKDSRDLVLVKRDEKHAIVARWKLRRATPRKFDAGPALEKSAGIPIEVLVLAVEGIEAIAH